MKELKRSPYSVSFFNVKTAETKQINTNELLSETLKSQCAVSNGIFINFQRNNLDWTSHYHPFSALTLLFKLRLSNLRLAKWFKPLIPHVGLIRPN